MNKNYKEFKKIGLCHHSYTIAEKKCMNEQKFICVKENIEKKKYKL